MRIPERASRLLDIDTPVIQAPMAGGTTTPELVAAVANAGGLGSIGAGYLSAEAIHDIVAATRARTERVFAINLFVPGTPVADAARLADSQAVLDGFRDELGLDRPAPVERDAPDFEAQFDAVVEAGVPVVSFTFGTPGAARVRGLQQRGTRVLGTATTVAEAEQLAGEGVDAIVVQGAEAGGHRATFAHDAERALIGTMALVPQVVDVVAVPVIASGGIMDGRGVAAAFMLGADAVQMGSAFLACEESGANPAHKQAARTAHGEDTVITRAFSGKPARGVRNRFIETMAPLEDRLPDYPIQNAWTKDVRAAAARAGRAEFMSLWAGQAGRLARPMPAAALVAEIREHLSRI